MLIQKNIRVLYNTRIAYEYYSHRVLLSYVSIVLVEKQNDNENVFLIKKKVIILGFLYKKKDLIKFCDWCQLGLCFYKVFGLLCLTMMPWGHLPVL